MTLLLTLACGSPTHLQYDHGRASAQAFSTQADLERESVQDAEYALMGLEGLIIRYRAAESATDKEDATTTFVVE
jgi:hypothetical protein